ncbi:MAG: homoprotocatechuate degradation operon regulator HpaR [bacterium]|nr:homoprotocatechuate degradation operon regulator HpaR [bacterium]
MALLRAREEAMRRFRPLLAAHDLTEQQWRVLRALTAADDRLDLTGLAERTALQVPSASRIIANLEGRGLVERGTTKGDQRRASLGLSDAGRGLVRRIAPHSEAAYNRIEEEFGAERLARLLEELAELAALSATEEAEAS